jgi:serpin B
MPFKSVADCRVILTRALCLLTFGSTAAATVPDIAPAVNSLGLDLYREQIKSAGNSGVLISPYSLATTLAMTYAGADGVTKTEMEKILHMPSDQTACGAAFASLAHQLDIAADNSARDAARMRVHGGDATPVQLTVANQLFVQCNFSLRTAFGAELRNHFGSNLAELDFKHDASHAREMINQWLANKTQGKIRNLLPASEPRTDTRLVLVNALYLKAAWANEFTESATKAEPFYFIGREAAPVPTMKDHHEFGYAKRADCSVVTLPYLGKALQFVLFIPDKHDGLASLEKSLTPETLAACTKLEEKDVILHLPKFKLEPETMALKDALQSLGLSTAFNRPPGSANFDRMAPRHPDDYLAISDIFHKTWLVLDEHGTEAAAATAVEMVTLGMVLHSPAPPIEVRADRPFLFAIQHVPSGACLFLGRVTDPR